MCYAGYIMDKYCSVRGTLLDNPGVRTLQNPGAHSVHCLVDVRACYGSGFEVLAPAAGGGGGGGGGYCRAFDLGSAGTSTMLAFARAQGKQGGSCSTCTSADAGAVARGFRATVVGTVKAPATSGAAATLEDVRALAFGAACPAGYAATAAPARDGALCFPAPAPTPAPATPVPTPAPFKVVVPTTLVGYSSATFKAGHQLAYRRAVSEWSSVAVSKTALRNIRDTRRAAGRVRALAAAVAALSVEFDVEVSGFATRADAGAATATLDTVTPGARKTIFLRQLNAAVGELADVSSAEVSSVSAALDVTVSGPVVAVQTTAAPTPAPAEASTILGMPEDKGMLAIACAAGVACVGVAYAYAQRLKQRRHQVANNVIVSSQKSGGGSSGTTGMTAYSQGVASPIDGRNVL